MSKVLCFVGSSGTGKSTLLNYLNEKHALPTMELGARKFLIPGISYDIQMNEKVQTQVCFNNFMTILEKMIAPQQENKFYCFSRSPIDVMAYEILFHNLDYLIDIQEDLLHKIQSDIIWIYLPIEFDLKGDDAERGTNEDVRKKTDKIIQDLLFENQIDYYTLSGDLETRQRDLDRILEDEIFNLNNNKNK